MGQKISSKYFTPPLTRAEKDVFYACLGLSELSFRFIELAGDQLLRGRCVGSAPTKVMLDLPKNFSNQSPQPFEVVVHYPKETLLVKPIRERSTLWEEVFPSPFNRLSALFERDDTVHIEVRPEEFLNQLKAWSSALALFEERMSMTELSCLHVKGPEFSCSLLFHFVRHRLVRVGAAGFLGELAEKYEKRELDARFLRDSFGTSVTFFCFEPPRDVEPKERLGALALQLQSALDDKRCLVGGPSPGDAATSSELGL
jgi:hypothetical protein